jgi:hypothetical protein
VYIAAEGSAGARKRLLGFQRYNENIGASTDSPFHMTAVAPNLGTGQDDLRELIAAIGAICQNPALIEIDTVAQTLGGADENGQGMAQLLINAIALSAHFKCFVLLVHHIGLSGDQRMRGWSGLKYGIDAELLCERDNESLIAKIKVKKLKDEETNLSLAAKMERVVLGYGEDGDEVTTLVVASLVAEEATRPQANKPPKVYAAPPTPLNGGRRRSDQRGGQRHLAVAKRPNRSRRIHCRSHRQHSGARRNGRKSHKRLADAQQ